MSDGKPSLRIDWFDGTVIEDPRPTGNNSDYADEEQPAPETTPKPQLTEKKPIGFKRLLDISLLRPPILNVEIAHRPGFWNLLDVELKGDFIVLIVKVLAAIYKSIEPGEKSKIVSMLRTRFEGSDFMNTLKEYLDGLPSVRIVEKRMNTQLWDDAESFFNNVLHLCEGIVKVDRYNVKYLREIHSLLECLEVSALGVKEEHTERFSDNLFTQIRELKTQIIEIIGNEAPRKHALETIEDIKHPCHFKNLSIFPSRDDLLTKNKLDIQPNIINGAYSNVEHYLDLQFKLLREDCFGPLREGICKYMENPSKRRHENIRVYPKVRIIRTYVSNNKVGHLVDIAWNERVNHGLINSKKYAYNKQLMFGSLLLFTSDNFDNILCATVLDSNMSLLKEGYITVFFQNRTSKNIFSQSFLMVESEVFFEPYHQVLKVLKNSRLDYLPMKRYIVDVQAETHPPSYLTNETIYTITEPYKTEEIPIPVISTDEWPNILIDLDESQLDAYKFALTREFAVIQGPPGTGKTYLGVKIASTLLRNLSLEGTPMLIICYTNHALDQFLEGILNVTTNIVRLGSQSKSDILEPYTLHNLRMRNKSKYSYLYANKRKELEKIFEQMVDLQTEIKKCEKEILSYKYIKPHLKVDDKNVELKNSKEDPVLAWLFAHLEEELESKFEENDEVDDWEKQLEDISLVDNKLDSCFSEEWALKEIDSMMNSIRYVKDITDDHAEGQKMTDKFEMQISKVQKRLNCFKKYRTMGQNGHIQQLNIKQTGDLNSLTTEQRWKSYYTAVESIKSDLLTKMNGLLEQHDTCNRELTEVATLTDSEVMRTARVVGVTTTTAARRHDLMRQLLSPIVIVEEAAEVLEAHIVASLTNHCQHLILIGDHKQLRPTASHYELARRYNIEISLFERMIRNGVHSRTLTIQRRMRPNMVQLLVPTVYDRLECHPLVTTYPNVRGMRDTLYFYDHDAFEDSEGLEDSWSHKNSLEAKWCVALANYLRQMKYSCEEVTILSTYTGQVTLLKELSKKYNLLRDVKITAVDNFQGEESRIVILSLVRSNRDGKIGFLSAANRICVALSRAKEGFYIFGNMNTLKSASPIWRSINNKLTEQNAIGRSLALCCDAHKDSILEIKNVEDFESCLKGTCLRLCRNI